MSHGYFYLHQNRRLIFKPTAVVDADPHYFDSPFVQRVWRVDSLERIVAWRVLLEALALGLEEADAFRFIHQHGLVLTDLPYYLRTEAHHGEITEERQRGLKRYFEVLHVPEDEFMAWLARTPDGENPDMDTMPRKREL
jgi:hypothetical protein